MIIFKGCKHQSQVRPTDCFQEYKKYKEMWHHNSDVEQNFFFYDPSIIVTICQANKTTMQSSKKPWDDLSFVTFCLGVWFHLEYLHRVAGEKVKNKAVYLSRFLSQADRHNILHSWLILEAYIQYTFFQIQKNPDIL